MKTKITQKLYIYTYCVCVIFFYIKEFNQSYSSQGTMLIPETLGSKFKVQCQVQDSGLQETPKIIHDIVLVLGCPPEFYGKTSVKTPHSLATGSGEVKLVLTYSLLSSFHRSGRCYEGFWGWQWWWGYQQSQPAVNYSNWNNYYEARNTLRYNSGITVMDVTNHFLFGFIFINV